MQFGRVDQTTSSFDAASPLSALQAGRRAWVGAGGWAGWTWGRKLEAFAIALSVFDDRVYEALRIYYWEAESARSESQVPYVAYHFAVPFFFEQGVEFDESNKKHWEKREWWNGGTREFHGNCQNRVASSWRLCRELLHRDGSNLSDFSAASLSFKLDLKVNSENENQMRGWNMNTYGIIKPHETLDSWCVLDVFSH